VIHRSHRRRRLINAGLVTAATLGLTALPMRLEQARAQDRPTRREIRHRLSDSHLHLVDFFQRSEGIRAVVEAMDRCGVDEAQITGMPLIKKWDKDEHVQPGYYLDDDAPCYWYSATDVLVARAVQSLPDPRRRRFHPFICGFNGTDRNAVEHIRRMVEWYPGFWKGIGEVMGRHDDLTALTYGETAKADHVALSAVYNLAAELDLPVSIHNNISSVWKREPVYVSEMDKALKNHPNTRFIWCHAGISRRVVVPSLVRELRRMLTAYSNLYVDVSWVTFESYLMQEGRPSTEWTTLADDFPSRLMVGSDKVAKFGDYEEETLKYYPFLDALRPDTARRVAKENFLAILPRKGARLKESSRNTSPHRGRFALFTTARPEPGSLATK
jgi:hypothetical protein